MTEYLERLVEVLGWIALTMLCLRTEIRVRPPEEKRAPRCNLDCEACNVMVHGLDASGRRAAGPGSRT